RTVAVTDPLIEVGHCIVASPIRSYAPRAASRRHGGAPLTFTKRQLDAPDGWNSVLMMPMAPRLPACAFSRQVITAGLPPLLITSPPIGAKTAVLARPQFCLKK